MDVGSAMARAVSAAAAVPGALGPNPRVGCIILDASGELAAEGSHHGAGTAHAEVNALAAAGDRARGGTAVVTLEPCNHFGHTPPCSEALLRAGVVRVVFGAADPTAEAAGGAQRLRAAGVEVVDLDDRDCHELVLPWATADARGRPWVTLKVAATLDGYVAAADGTSKWITSEESRRAGHELRAKVDAIAVGTGTAIADRPSLTVRLPGVDVERPPQRIVIGDRPVDGDFWRISGHDPRAALQQMYDRGIRHVLLEGGPTIGSAFLRAGAVDEILWMQAPLLLGSGTPAIGDLGVETLGRAQHWLPQSLDRFGPDWAVLLRRH